MRALKSFPPGKAGGLDSLTPTHLMDLVRVGGLIKEQLLDALAAICDVIINGKIPETIKNLFYGCWLIALIKKREVFALLL
jgi:hypothetical protein